MRPANGSGGAAKEARKGARRFPASCAGQSNLCSVLGNMIPEIDNATKADLRSWWVNLPESLVRKDSQEFVLDEIAWALSRKDPEWIAFLTEYAYSEDLNRRASAVYFLASKLNRTPATEQILLDAFHSGVLLLQVRSLWGCIHSDFFPLTKEDIASLDNSADERLPALGMTYLCYAFPKERIAILRSALRNENPRMREYACDVIGDEFIQELKGDMEPLLQDTDTEVAECAKYNYCEMLD